MHVIYLLTFSEYDTVTFFDIFCTPKYIVNPAAKIDKNLMSNKDHNHISCSIASELIICFTIIAVIQHMCVYIRNAIILQVLHLLSIATSRYRLMVLYRGDNS